MRIFDNCKVTLLPPFLDAISDAMNGNANDIMASLNGTGTGQVYIKWSAGFEGNQVSPLKSKIVSNSTEYLDLVGSFSRNEKPVDDNNRPRYIQYRAKDSENYINLIWISGDGQTISGDEMYNFEIKISY